ncbi:Fe-S cluster assembly ATPase SufC [Candidatus Marsarchaeota archaeon]|jgi:Fe-S cluster assembly ATP-binding protein|nr:Fe-S cluster assembly ATPase SufC [Candidatus Marsarchaeota archaeon]
MILEVKDLHVAIEGKEIVAGVNIKVKQGEVHVIMGHNGSGKTTLAKTIMGHPKLKPSSGDILVDGQSILTLSTDKRAKLGLFLGFQNPVEVEGVGFINFLHSAKEAVAATVNTKELMADIRTSAVNLKMVDNLIGRSLNQGFSGGEKKKAEVLQMGVLQPKIAILDEPDSGLDIDAVKVVAENINAFAEKYNIGLVIITHYSRILSYMHPQFVHVMANGKIVAEGGKELIEKLEKEGYESFTKVSKEV